MNLDVCSIAKRVKRGVKLLEGKIPNWRTVLRQHCDEFDFNHREMCVLGTLEHYSGRMAVLKRQHSITTDDRYRAAMGALGLQGDADEEYGFDRSSDDDEEIDLLDALWRAEFEKS